MKQLVFFLLVFSVAYNKALSQTFNRQKLDSLCNILSKNDKLLGGLYISKNGKEIFSHTFDNGNRFKGITRIGSITKVYTAVLILQLVEEGKLKLEDKLSKYYPAMDGSDKITLLQMLTHQSGIYSFDNDYVLGDSSSWVYKPQPKEAMLKRFYAYKLQFEPGTKTSYSNTAYSLLGYIIEDITKSTYNEQLQKRICKKIGISNTRCSDKVETAKNESLSFIKDNGWVPYLSSDLSSAAAAGCISSSPADVAAFYSAVFNGKLLSPQTVERMLKEDLAFNKDELADGVYGYGHLGSIDAYFNSATFNPADSVCFVFLFNGLSYPFSDVFFKTIDIFYGRTTTLPNFQSIVLDEKSLKKFEGKYKLRSGDVVKIKRKADTLYFVWDVKGYGTLKLNAVSENVFLYEPKGITFKFGYNKTKEVDKVTMYQGKQVVRMDKQ